MNIIRLKKAVEDAKFMRLQKFSKSWKAFCRRIHRVKPLTLDKKLRKARRRLNRLAIRKEKISSPFLLSQISLDKDQLLIDYMSNIDQAFENLVEKSEEKAENFLALLATGGIFTISTLYQGEVDSIGSLDTLAGAMFVFAIFLICLIKIYRIDRSYWQRGEWQKARNAFVSGSISFPELIWVKENSWKNVNFMAILALVSLIFSFAGFILVFINMFVSSLLY